MQRCVAAALAAALFGGGSAAANPTGPAVVSGSATVTTRGTVLEIANSPNTIIHWQRFGIGRGEVTRFVQGSAGSAVLNRVVTPGASQILGALQSNGRVFLINPSGIVFGTASRVDVAGLVASALDIADADFLAGRLRFAGGTGTVSAHGAITSALGGAVYLIGAEVVNRGTISAPDGEVVLAAGRAVELFEPGTPNLRVEITEAGRAFDLGRIATGIRQDGLLGGLVVPVEPVATTAVATQDGRIVLSARGVAPAAGSSAAILPASTTTGTAARRSVIGTVADPASAGSALAVRSGTAGGVASTNPASVRLSGTGFETVSNPGQPNATFVNRPTPDTFTGSPATGTAADASVLAP